jgi:putative intracellular protease/amidase
LLEFPMRHLALLPLLIAAPVHADAPAPKVLLVVSGEGREEAGKIVRPGFEMDELALAWLTLRANGLQLEIASPQGGAVLADRYNPKDDHNAAFLADTSAQAALATTRRTADIRAGEHAAIFVIGGKGAMFDLPRTRR